MTASFEKSPYDNWVQNSLPDAGKTDKRPANLRNSTQASLQSVFGGGTFHFGKVRDSSPCGGVVVSIQDHDDLVCTCLAQSFSSELGVSDSSMPDEGSHVLVFRPSATSQGYVLGVAPLSQGDEAPPAVSGLLDMESSASEETEAVYSTAPDSPDNARFVRAPGTRPLDVFPGDKCSMTPDAVGTMIGRLMASLQAGDRARVEVSLMDDMVRIIAGYLSTIGPLGTSQQFNDCGYLSSMTSASLHQCERSGHSKYGEPVLEDTGAPASADCRAARLKLKVKDLMPRRRLQVFTGWLGDIFSAFVSKPDPKTDPMTFGAKSADQGLASVHVDSSGRVSVSSASGISLQRWDRLPVPKQMREPWDPEGDEMDEREPSERLPFKYDDEFVHARNLWLRDAAAWYAAKSVQRIHDQKLDFNLPEEADMKTPDDVFDEMGKSSGDFVRNEFRRAFMNVEDDGSIIIRDAWGSEIHMRGGNIVFNCPGQIEMRSGKSVVVLAGDDVNVKAFNSVDISATEKDVRVKSEGNLHCVSNSGGVLLESLATDDTVSFSGEGEDVMSSGVVLRAPDSTVLLDAPTVHASANKRFVIETFKPGDTVENSGEVAISTRKVVLNADESVLLSVSDKTAMSLTRTDAALYGHTTRLVSRISSYVIDGGVAWVPANKVDIGLVPYDDLKPVLEELKSTMQEVEWLAPYTPETRDAIVFSHRSTSQYGTDIASEVDGSQFFVYQPVWVFMSRGGAPSLSGLSTDKWIEKDVEDTYPWPGADYYKGSTAYVRLKSENNIAAGTGVSKRRDELVPEGGELERVSFDEYEKAKG